MRLIFAIIVCKILHFVGSLVGKGSSLPGKVALKLCPDAISHLVLPGIVIAVTGSNGKSSTTEMIAHALESNGLKTAWNREGANQTEGIATVLLKKSTLGGQLLCSALVLECDERYTPKIFEQLRPTSLLITNICRDQLTRNGHHEYVQECLKKAINSIQGAACATLVLNADDPYVAALAQNGDEGELDGKKMEVIWYGIGVGAVTEEPRIGIYDDGAFCPCCKARMNYSYRVTGHFGSYRCEKCAFKRKKADIEVTTKADSGDVSISVFEQRKRIHTSLAVSDTNNAYNMVAAIAGSTTAGIDAENASRALENYDLKGGRRMKIKVGGSKVTLLIAKHENSLAYNRALASTVSKGAPCTVIIVVDTISRKYYTSETSWLWDIDFDILTDECVRKILLVGRYSGELMMRLAMTSAGSGKCIRVPEIEKLRGCIKSNASGDVYAITCFSDKAKLLKAISKN